jgi:hypothetical protein
MTIMNWNVTFKNEPDTVPMKVNLTPSDDTAWPEGGSAGITKGGEVTTAGVWFIQIRPFNLAGFGGGWWRGRRATGINLTNSPLCVQWFTNPQTSAMAPTCNTVISSAVKVNTMNNICNAKYWGITHQVLTAHSRVPHLNHHRHAHSWTVALRQTRRNLTQIVARQRQRLADVAWPSLHALYGQHAPLGLRRACACFDCGSEFWLSTAGHCRQQNFLNLSQHVYLFVYNNIGYMIIFFSKFFPLKYRCDICLFQNVNLWKYMS